MKTPLIKKLNAPAIINAASHLKQKGQLEDNTTGQEFVDYSNLFTTNSSSCC